MGIPQEHSSFADSKTEQPHTRECPAFTPGAEKTIPALTTHGSPGDRYAVIIPLFIIYFKNLKIN